MSNNKKEKYIESAFWRIREFIYIIVPIVFAGFVAKIIWDWWGVIAAIIGFVIAWVITFNIIIHLEYETRLFDFLFKPNVERMEVNRDVEGLIKALRFDDEGIREKAAEALGKIGDVRAVEPLIQALKYEPDWEPQEKAAEALGRIGDVRAVEPLIQALTDEYRGVRIVVALGRIGDARAVDPLIQALNDKNEDVREKAAEILDKLGWTPRDKTEKSQYLTAKKKWGELVKLGEPAVEPLIHAMETGGEEVGEKAVWALGRIKDVRAVKPLIKALNDDFSDVYPNKIIDALGRIGDARAVKPLIQALKDEDEDVRKKAAVALGKIKVTLKAKNKKVKQQIEDALRKKGKIVGKFQKEIAAVHRGGLGEPYCSEECYRQASTYAMLDIDNGVCGICHKSIYSSMHDRNYSVIPYEGDTLIVCRNCISVMEGRLRNYGKCCMCQNSL